MVKALVRPGIEILSKEAAQLRAIEPTPKSGQLHVYLGLFDPILTLSHQLLQATESGDTGRSHNLELLIAGLSDEQIAAAREFGFDACGVGFTQALGGAG